MEVSVLLSDFNENFDMQTHFRKDTDFRHQWDSDGQIVSAIATAAHWNTEWTDQVVVTSQRASHQQVKLVRRFLSACAFRHLFCSHLYVTERLSFWSSGSWEQYCCHSSTSFYIPEVMFRL